MSRKPHSETSLRATAEELLGRAEAAHKLAEEQVQQAKEQRTHALQQHGALGAARTSTSAQALLYAEADLAGAEDHVKNTLDAVKQAKIALERLKTEENTGHYENGCEETERKRQNVNERIKTAVLAAELALHAAVLSVVEAYRDFLVSYERTDRYANALRRDTDLARRIPRVSIADVRLACARAATMARHEAGRDPVNDWIAELPIDWRTADMNADELAQSAWAAARARADEATRAIVDQAVATIAATHTVTPRQAAPVTPPTPPPSHEAVRPLAPLAPVTPTEGAAQ